MNRKSLLRSSLLVPVCLLALACGRDRTVDDYKREKNRQDFSLYQSVSGVYTGLLNAANDGHVMGALQLDIQAQMQAANNPTTNNSASPNLVVELTFQDFQPVKVNGSESYYDPDSGVFQSNIKATDASKTEQTIIVAGQFSGSHVTGTLQVQGYKSKGGQFDLVLRGPTLASLASDRRIQARAVSSQYAEITSYQGVTNFPLEKRESNGLQKDVAVVILKPRNGPIADFVDLLIPIKTVDVAMNYDVSASINYPGATWDQESGVLTGQATLTNTVNGTGQPVNVSLKCDTRSNPQMTCTHYTSQSGVIAETRAKQLTGGTTARTPVDKTDTDRAVTLVFDGTGAWSGGANDHAFQLSVTFPARTRLQDIYDLYLPESQRTLQTTMVFSPDLSVSFTTQWDMLNGHLDVLPQSSGNTSGGQSGATATDPLWIPQLHCDGFYFQQTKQPFRCQYYSNRSGMVSATFRAPGHAPNPLGRDMRSSAPSPDDSKFSPIIAPEKPAPRPRAGHGKPVRRAK